MDRWHPPCSQLSVVPGVADVCKGDHLDLFGETIGRFPRIDDPQPLQFKVFNCRLHGSGRSGGVFILEFHPPVLSTRLPEKIEFRAGVGVPEIEIPIFLSQGSADAIQGKTFPGSAEPGRSVQLLRGFNGQQGMVQPGVAQVQFRPLHKTFPDVDKPGLEDADHERAFQNIAVFPDRHVGDAEGTAYLRIVQDVAVVMAQHGPEAAKRPGGDCDPQLGDVPFQKGRHVLVPPEQALIVRRRQEGSGQSPAPPQGLDGPGIDIAEAEPAQLNIGDPPGQGFRTLANQIPRGASQDDEPATFSLIHQIAHERKKIGQPLDLVDDDESRQILQCELRLFQPGKILGIFQIEIGIGGERSSQRRFSALPGAKNRRDGKYGHELG